ncbi:MAG: NAD(P)H-dependent oxidoreductase [Bacteroidota bacterium]
MGVPITIVSATNRHNSLAGQVAQHYATLLQQHGCPKQILSLTDLPADFTNSALYENMGQDAGFNQLKKAMEVAQKYVFVVPEYNGSFPGVFKAFIDGLKFPDTFTGKKCALVGLSKGPQGGAFAMSHLTDIFHYLGMQVLARKVRLASIQDSQLATVLANTQYVTLLGKQAAEIIDF